MNNANANTNVCPPQRRLPQTEKLTIMQTHAHLQFLSITIGDGQCHLHGSNYNE